jgi:hypothetical protein
MNYISNNIYFINCFYLFRIFFDKLSFKTKASDIELNNDSDDDIENILDYQKIER